MRRLPRYWIHVWLVPFIIPFRFWANSTDEWSEKCHTDTPTPKNPSSEGIKPLDACLQLCCWLYTAGGTKIFRTLVMENCFLKTYSLTFQVLQGVLQPFSMMPLWILLMVRLLTVYLQFIHINLGICVNY